jgi:hypothetical protein
MDHHRLLAREDVGNPQPIADVQDSVVLHALCGRALLDEIKPIVQVLKRKRPGKSC